MASDFCYSVEMQKAMARHQTNQARVLPILVRQTDWKDAPFSILQMLPTDTKPVVNWTRRDDAFTDVVKGIRKAIEDLNANGATLPRVLDTTLVESIPMPLWNVPSRRNSYFTGQEAILKYLHTTLKSDMAAALTQPQAISGLGGIGKTQIAFKRRSEEHTSELQSHSDLVCRLLLEKKKTYATSSTTHIYREQNQESYALANEGMDEADGKSPTSENRNTTFENPGSAPSATPNLINP